jgi:hypothetical protein
MSTQRRASRWRKTGCMDGSKSLELSSSGSSAQFDHAHGNGRTAPAGFFHPSDKDLSPGAPARFHPSDKDLSPGAPARLATNSLQSDYHSTQLVGLVPSNIRRGSPPPGAGSHSAASRLKSQGSSLLHIPFPSGFARLLPSLPRVPIAKGSRTERYDGKRDLYLQHAA